MRTLSRTHAPYPRRRPAPWRPEADQDATVRAEFLGSSCLVNALVLFRLISIGLGSPDLVTGLMRCPGLRNGSRLHLPFETLAGEISARGLSVNLHIAHLGSRRRRGSDDTYPCSRPGGRGRPRPSGWAFGLMLWRRRRWWRPARRWFRRRRARRWWRGSTPLLLGQSGRRRRLQPCRRPLNRRGAHAHAGGRLPAC